MIAPQVKDLSQFVAAQIWSREITTQVDRVSCEVSGSASLDLMERAGRAVFEVIQANFKNHDGVIILAGPGNNGGDALVATRFLQKSGIKTETILVWDDDQKISPSCLHQLSRLSGKENSCERYYSGLMQKNWPHLLTRLLSMGLLVLA